MAVSCDALQVYRGLEVLTAAPTTVQREKLEHRLIGFLSLDETFSAGEYARLAHREIDSLLNKGKRPIIIGGTGLYLRAAVAELDMRAPVDPERRHHWQTELEKSGPEALHELLIERDPEVAAATIPTDSRRIVRAHELLDRGERLLTVEDSQLWTAQTRHPTLLVGLVMDRELLGERIDARVDQMVACGVIEEVQRASEQGASVTARKALGFEQLLAGDVDLLKLRTRQYARRQLTWMRKLPNANVVDVTNRDPYDVATELIELLQPFQTNLRSVKQDAV